ncbi:hypothetical protein SLEP1_g37483 [Rubroshorea leprosula]|uniref:Uncharacterized protein n=1 Tax=Rubroshorea leprosula TaxID=152421 RepID=A0AAV5KUQ9_9ROSI|nr:hypothetical protein SLEP1_g37483 [Rubroshorea leprosula]
MCFFLFFYIYMFNLQINHFISMYIHSFIQDLELIKGILY